MTSLDVTPNLVDVGDIAVIPCAKTYACLKAVTLIFSLANDDMSELRQGKVK